MNNGPVDLGILRKNYDAFLDIKNYFLYNLLDPKKGSDLVRFLIADIH